MTMTLLQTDHEPLAEALHAALEREAEAWATAEVVKLECAGIEAREGLEIRRKAAADGVKLTEGQHTEWVTLNAAVVTARLAAVDAEHAYRRTRIDVAVCELRASLVKARLYSHAGGTPWSGQR